MRVFVITIVMLLLLAGCGAATENEGENDMPENTPVNTATPENTPAPESTPQPTVQPTPAPPPMPVVPTAEIRDKPVWEEATKFVCHYGAFSEVLGLFDIAILESSNITAEQLAWLSERGVWTVGYVSVGEDHNLRQIDGQGPGGYASFYIDDGTGEPRKNNNWNSYFVDAGSGLWQQLVVDRVRAMLDMGFDGIFLDTIDTAEIFPETREGMAALIRRLRNSFPEAKIVANRGFFMMEDFAPYISGIMFESFTGGYDFGRQQYIVHRGGDLQWTTAVANSINRIREEHYFPVFALDYAAPHDIETIQMLYDRAWEFDFLPAVSVILLNQVFWREVEPQTERGSLSGLTRWRG